jgi:Putative zinc-finger
LLAVSSVHIEENLLEQYAIDALPEQPRAEVDEHLLGCPECQSRLVQLDAFLAAFRPAVLEIQREPAGGKRFRLLPRLVWLSSVAVPAACLVILFLRPAVRPVAPAIIQMQALRGPERAVQVTPGQSALLVFDVAGHAVPAAYEIELVDRSGRAVWTVHAEAKDQTLSVPVRKLDPGSYWVRMYRVQPTKELLEEYALRVAEAFRVKR